MSSASETLPATRKLWKLRGKPILELSKLRFCVNCFKDAQSLDYYNITWYDALEAASQCMPGSLVLILKKSLLA